MCTIRVQFLDQLGLGNLRARARARARGRARPRARARKREMTPLLGGVALAPVWIRGPKRGPLFNWSETREIGVRVTT